MNKKLQIMFITFMALISVGFSAQYITECEQANVTWVADEIYNINLDDSIIDDGDISSTYCLRVTSSVANLTFNSLNPSIDVNVNTKNFDFIQYSQQIFTSYEFNDFNITANDNSYLQRFFAGTHSTNQNGVQMSINNLELRNFDYGFWVISGANTGSNRADISDMAITDSEFHNLYNVVYTTQCSACFLVSPQRVDFVNSLAILRNLESEGAGDIYNAEGVVGGIDTLGNGRRTNMAHIDVYYNNSVSTREIKRVSGSYTPADEFYLESSFVGNIFRVDLDNDNIDDSQSNALIVKEYNDVTYFMSVSEANDILGVYDLNDEMFFAGINIRDELETLTNSNLDESGTTKIFNVDDASWRLASMNAITLNNGQTLTCGDYLNKLNCVLDDDSSSTTWQDAYNRTIKYRGLINTLSNNEISNVQFDMTLFNQTHPDSFYSVISNLYGGVDSTISNVTIRDNTFYLDNFQDGNFPNDADISPVIKLRGDNFLITGNAFYQFPKTASISDYHFQTYIESDIPQNNEITLNTFNSSGVAQVSVISNQCDAYVYHNSLDTNVTLYTNCETEPLINKKVGYEHTDNNVYYFILGNYYGTCTDGGGDGFCDSPYVDGNITDNYALSEYPFNFVTHLVTAESMTANDESFSINLSSLIEGETIEIAGSGSNIDVSFSHNSTFADLTCDYIIDSSLVTGARLYDVNNSIHTQGFTGWSEGSHTAQINCFNDYQDISSSLINFSVTYTGGGSGEPGNETEVGSVGGTDYDVDGFDFIDLNDIDGTTDNVIGSFANIGAFLWNIGVPALIGLVVMGAILFVVVLIR